MLIQILAKKRGGRTVTTESNLRRPVSAVKRCALLRPCAVARSHRTSHDASMPLFVRSCGGGGGVFTRERSTHFPKKECQIQGHSVPNIRHYPPCQMITPVCLDLAPHGRRRSGGSLRGILVSLKAGWGGRRIHRERTVVSPVQFGRVGQNANGAILHARIAAIGTDARRKDGGAPGNH